MMGQPEKNNVYDFKQSETKLTRKQKDSEINKAIVSIRNEQIGRLQKVYNIGEIISIRGILEENQIRMFKI